MNLLKYSIAPALYCAAMFLQLSSLAQKPVDCSYSLDRKGVYVFTANNKTFCPYVVRVNFTSMDNGKTDHELPYEGQVKPGVNTLFRLSKVNASGDIIFKYSVSYRKGTLSAPVNTDHVYMLPIAPGKETQAYITETKTGDSRSLYAVRLRMKPGDTIFAARAGIVTAVDAGSAQNDAGATGTEGWNAIEIYQADSTFAEYGIVKKDGALVRPGQTVAMGTPIGLVGGDAYGRGSEGRFSVYYYQDNTPYFVSLQFWTKKNGKGMLKHGGEYVCEKPAEPVTKPAKTSRTRVR